MHYALLGTILFLGVDYMFDLHHDLLSIMYYSYLQNNYDYLNEWIKNFNSDNVFGLIANLYFMNEEEMKSEIGDTEINVKEMFKKSTEMFKSFLPDIKVIYSIEGCDYIKDTNELEELYNMGLRNILLVWNNPNRYGSGNKSDYGLTIRRKEFLIKAIDLGISIDLSHMNKKTFYDTVELIKEQKALGKKVKAIASHSNCYDMCDHIRNLDDEQLKALRSIDGYIGIIAYSLFLSKKKYSNDYLRVLYLRQIKHAIDILGIDRVCISTDDMTFSKGLFNEDCHDMVFDYSTIKNDLKELLLTEFEESDVNKIMYENINELYKEEL